MSWNITTVIILPYLKALQLSPCNPPTQFSAVWNIKGTATVDLRLLTSNFHFGTHRSAGLFYSLCVMLTCFFSLFYSDFAFCLSFKSHCLTSASFPMLCDTSWSTVLVGPLCVLYVIFNNLILRYKVVCVQNVENDRKRQARKERLLSLQLHLYKWGRFKVFTNESLVLSVKLISKFLCEMCLSFLTTIRIK